jgi:hypothetical protein
MEARENKTIIALDIIPFAVFYLKAQNVMTNSLNKIFQLNSQVYEPFKDSPPYKQLPQKRVIALRKL